MIIISSSSLQMLSIMLSISTCLLLFGGVESATTSSSSSSLMAFHFQLPHHQHNLHSTSTSPSSSSSTRTLSFVRGDIMGLRCHRTNTSSASSRRSLVASRLFLSSSSGSGFGNNANNNNKSSQKSLSSSSSSSLSPKNELFELQELRAQLQTILKQNIPNQSLSKEKREELSKYVYAIVDKTTSPINISGKDGNTMGIANFVVGIENKSWRMVFTTDSGNNNGGASSSSSSLPAGSTVILRVGEFLGMQGKLDYVLKYGERIMGLNELVAKSTCSVDIGPINPGLLTFQYEDIKTNMFGVSNLPVGFFGLLKGRVNCIDTVWFDGERWIERNYAENGDVVYSVYVRDVEDERR